MSQHSAAATFEKSDSKPKRIILFSDGTGNSSGKLNKTNVWRMYTATDFGIPEDIRNTVQIGRYDNGVGTSTFRPLAVLQGVFGWGLARNVKSLYLFLCQNYREGDEVCLFGFSRGAFTVRVLANLINEEGIIPWTHGDSLGQLTNDAYRHYRRNIAPPMPPMRWIIPWMKQLHLLLVALVRLAFRQDRYKEVEKQKGRVDFLGVWDTVDAYGGPIVELVRAIDNWIMRISFKDSALPDCVTVARHALALDDERDSFQPRPWDEAHGTSRTRLQQVWFAGMHSDVGGGYPEQGLAYVSLCWMMEHALVANIRLQNDKVREALEERDAFGRLHDSRAGLGGYYRYQPRDIGAYIEPPQPGTEQVIDPKLPEDEGLVNPILVHESVFQRIDSGTDGYAPITIPRSYKIVTDRLKMGKDGPVVANSATGSSLRPETVSNLLKARLQEDREKARQKVLDQVWWRRIFYFAIVIVSVVGAWMPTWRDSFLREPQGGLFSLLALPFQALAGITPDALSAWPDTFAKRPLLTWALILLLFILFQSSAWIERRLRGFSRKQWHCVIQGSSPEALPGGWVRSLRTSAAYQGWLRSLKWHALPALFGILMLLILISGVATLAVQLRLSSSPAGGPLACTNEAQDGSLSNSEFDTSQPCTSLPVRVEEGRHYRLFVSIPAKHPWYDGGVAADPEGRRLMNILNGGADIAFVGMRRSLDAAWMQPLVFIVPEEPGNEMSVHPVAVRKGRRRGADVYAGEFTARETGWIGIGVNDAIAPPPWPADAFYKRKWIWWYGRRAPLNSGKGCVELWEETSDPERRFEPRLRCPNLTKPPTVAAMVAQHRP